MASTEIVSNLKLITSGNVPTTSNLGNGELAFGLVDGVAKLYGNVNGTIVDFSDFLRTAPVTSVAGKTGAVSLAKDDVGLGNVDNVKQYSASNPPPYPVTSVAGKTGTVILSAEDVGAEPAFHKNTAFNKNFGNISGTVAQGNDSRIVNAVQTSGDQAIWGKKTFMTISPVVPSKTRKATNSGTSIATEAQVYKVEQELSEKQDALTSQQIVNINNVPNKLDKHLGTRLAGQYLVVSDDGDIITTDTIDGGELKDTVVTFDDVSGMAPNIASGETVKTLFGKIKNWFGRLKTLAFKDTIKNADIAGNADIAQHKIHGLRTDYVASLSVSGKTVTYKNFNGNSLGTITTQDTTYGSYWAVLLNASIPTYYGGASISFSFTTNNGYDESLIGVNAELKDILLASSVNIYRTQTDYANAYPKIDLGELHSHIYNEDGLADGKQIIKGKASIENGGTIKDYDCLLFVYESGTDVYLTIGLVEEDKNSVYMSRDIRLDQSDSIPVAAFYTGNS